MTPSETIRLLGRPIAYHPKLAKLLGSVNAAILFGQLVYWSDKTDHELGIYKTAEQIEEETGLSPKEQKTAREKLVKLKVLTETHRRLEHRLYFKINFDVYDEFVLQYSAKSDTENTENTDENSGNEQSENTETQKGGSGNSETGIPETRKRNSGIDKSEVPETQKCGSEIDKSAVGEVTNGQPADTQNVDSYKGALDYNTRLQHKTTTKDIDTETVIDSRVSKLRSWKKTSFDYLIKLGIEKQIALDWLEVRKNPVTETAIKFMTSEGKKCNLSIVQVITLCAERGWSGFRASYLQNEINYQSNAARPSVKNDPKPSVKEIPEHTKGGVQAWL